MIHDSESASDEMFDVTPPQAVEDLTGVVEQRSLAPQAQRVKVRIAKAAIMKNKTEDLAAIMKNKTEDLAAIMKNKTEDLAAIMKNKTEDLNGLKLEVRIVDGIPVTQPDGTVQYQFVNKPMFTSLMDLCYYANPQTRTSNWYLTRQHLVEFKKFCVALGLDLSGIIMSDEFLKQLVGRELLVDITHKAEQRKDVSGGYVDTGTFKERLRNWKRVE